MSLSLVDIEVPGGDRFEHHVVHSSDAAGVLMTDPVRGVLLIWRHRFISDTWGWEIPAGRIDAGELPIEAAHREAVEETGWVPGPLRPLIAFRPIGGQANVRFHTFISEGATFRGEPSDPSESERLEWVSTDRFREIVRSGEMDDGLSLAACSYALAFSLAG